MNETTITPITTEITPTATPITTEELKNDCLYFQAQQCILHLWESGLISADEYKKITQLNHHSFQPFLYEIMADISG